MQRMCSLVIVCAGLAASATAQFQEVPGSMEFSGRVIAKPLQIETLAQRGLNAAQVERTVRDAKQTLAAYEEYWYEPLVDHHTIVVPAGMTDNQLIAKLAATGLYEFVEPDWTLYPIDCPDDTRFNQQWHHDTDHLDSCIGWDIHTGDPSTSIGICDTGIQTNHPDLLLHRLEGYNAVDRVWEDDGGAITPVHPHGTQTTGCAAANGDNGVGVSGIGWNLSHRMMRVSNSSSGSASLTDLTHAALTAVQAGDKVASVSYSGVNSSAIRSTATQIKNLGGLLVWAAGNDGANLNWGDRDNDDIIVAGATDINDNRSGFSAYGPSVDLMAPGSSVYTTTTGSGYGSVSGTSFACPLTAGLAALIWSHNPDLTPDEVELALKLGCDDLGANGVDNNFGYGRINVNGSLLLAGDPAVEFDYPNGLPDLIDPNGGATVDVVITTNDTTLDGLPTLFYDDGSGYQTADLVHMGGDDYQIVFPAFDCGAEIDYYLSADTTDGDTVNNPSNAPTSTWEALAVVGIVDMIVDDFETDNGWTVEDIDLDTGSWDRAVPANGGSRGDPASDYDGSGRCWVTGNGNDEDIDGGPTRLISPAYDLSATPGAIVSYARWFTNDDNDIDRLDVHVSDDDGASWTLVESVRGGADWVKASFVVADFVNTTSTVRVRFSATDNPNDSVTEGAIDDFRISTYDCGDDCYADFNGDGAVNTQDVLAFLNAWNAGDTSADCNDDGSINTVDVLCFLNLWNAGC